MSYAIELTKNGGVEVLDYKEAQKPQIKDDQILVNNKAIGINFIDTYQRSGLYPTQLPFVLGREGAGIVEEVGSKVTKFKKGDRVAYMTQGSYANYTPVPQNLASIVPDNLDFEVAASIPLQGLTAYTMVTESYQVKKGDTVLVHAAAGGVGLLLVQLSKYFGAKVIGTVSTEAKAELVKKAGADHTILYSKEDFGEKVLEITNGKGVQAVFDGVGKDTFEGSLKSCGHLATFVSFGNASGKVPPVDIFKLTAKSVKLMRTSLFSFFTGDDSFDNYNKELFKLFADKKVEIFNIKTFPLKQVADAHNELEGRKSTGKLVLIP
ncbi:alcohol dehydrogenase zinc-binding domain protein [Neoconidiobolus thromboides FSU 785]|nr:alcohol dehydrogenase zinc-binding domain protein [Neoconidiobolus thromboides FSU 785]